MIGRRVGGGKPKIYLYNAGDQCTDVTGGFTFTKTDGNATGSITYGTSYIEFKCPLWSQYAFATVNSINYPQYSRINIQYSYGSLGSYASLTCVETAMIWAGSVVTPSPACITKSYVNAPVTITISNTNTGYIRIHKIWLS